MSVRTLPAGAGAAAERARWITFAICAGAAFVTTLDLSIVNVAFPEIVREFGATRADVSWIVTTYNIFFGSFLVVAGKIADQVGRKRVFLSGVGVFAVGSTICSIAPSLDVLIAGRAVQGVGGAFMAPASLGLLLAAFPAERRTQTVAIWGGVGALGVASGPSLGALLISMTDWRAAFWINIPICLTLLVVGARILVETPRVVSATRRPDYAGALMVTAALAAVALGLSQSDTWGWFDPRTLGSLGFGALLATLFARRQRVHPEPVLDLALFESQSFSVANLAGVAFFAGFAAFGLNGVLFLRGVWGYSVLHAGLLSALAPLTVAALAPLSGKLAARWGFRPFVVIGPLLVATATLLSRFVLTETPTPLTLVLFNQLAAVGIAAFIPVNAAAAVSELPPARLSVGGAVNNTSRQVGSVLGVALLVSVIGAGTDVGGLLDGHRNGWTLIAVCVITSALISTFQPKVWRHRAVPGDVPVGEPVAV